MHGMRYKLGMQEAAWVFKGTANTGEHPSVYEVNGYPSWERPMIIETPQKGWHVIMRDEQKKLVGLGYHPTAAEALETLQRFVDATAA